MDYFKIAWQTTKSYFKAQLILMSITLFILCISFALLNIKLWLLWAILITLFDLLPLLGTGIILVPWAIICFILGNFSLGGWLLLVYCILVIVRQILEPIIIGKKIGLNPLITFLAVLLGGMVAGPVGFILGPIVAAILKAIMLEQEKKKQEKDNTTNITTPKQ